MAGMYVTLTAGAKEWGYSRDGFLKALKSRGITHIRIKNLYRFGGNGVGKIYALRSDLEAKLPKKSVIITENGGSNDNN